ncbi:hypothetical protein TREMEDRAFT_64194 [Tremella mesenterica DSM 1558]|uniref:uncharacterized protein n=1 Tax=Tremella mesenterica (strain ATCC 24925 / CBS 8224 / DSM 1558 / NBRC 9311 / NRRL Y-6157 / RJB 2259-6 / UBC 559-6) TaxID=578456 RepID=UPI0003F495F3|nr:uncharacterized protein TREMEDRAFT_64194 [Tremella mesenterica DSM 1558]EIW67601.1 hypothetical protein TREMEDRAFT_64194 [Tremella mesenterica DSM 1558]
MPTLDPASTNFLTPSAPPHSRPTSIISTHSVRSSYSSIRSCRSIFDVEFSTAIAHTMTKAQPRKMTFAEIRNHHSKVTIPIRPVTLLPSFLENPDSSPLLSSPAPRENPVLSSTPEIPTVCQVGVGRDGLKDRNSRSMEREEGEVISTLILGNGIRTDRRSMMDRGHPLSPSLLSHQSVISPNPGPHHSGFLKNPTVGLSIFSPTVKHSSIAGETSPEEESPNLQVDPLVNKKCLDVTPARSQFNQEGKQHLFKENHNQLIKDELPAENKVIPSTLLNPFTNIPFPHPERHSSDPLAPLREIWRELEYLDEDVREKLGEIKDDIEGMREKHKLARGHRKPSMSGGDQTLLIGCH